MSDLKKNKIPKTLKDMIEQSKDISVPEMYELVEGINKTGDHHAKVENDQLKVKQVLRG